MLILLMGGPPPKVAGEQQKTTKQTKNAHARHLCSRTFAFARSQQPPLPLRCSLAAQHSLSLFLAPFLCLATRVLAVRFAGMCVLCDAMRCDGDSCTLLVGARSLSGSSSSVHLAPLPNATEASSRTALVHSAPPQPSPPFLCVRSRTG